MYPPDTVLTEGAALQFVQRLRPVGLVELHVAPVRVDPDSPRGRAFITARWKAIPARERLRFDAYTASSIERGDRVGIYVTMRADGSLYAKVYVTGDPWVQDWCRPLEEADTIQDCPIDDSISDSIDDDRCALS